MKTLVVGANGKIGRILCRVAAERKKPMRALLRDPEQQAYFDSIGVETALGDLEGASGDHALSGVEISWVKS